MNLKTPLAEVEDFLSNCYHIKVNLCNVNIDQIKVQYVVSILLTIKEVKEHEIVFQYEVNGLLDLIAIGAHHFLENKLADSPLEWNAKTKEVAINLDKVLELKGFLMFLYISELRFENECILLVLKTRQNEVDK